MRTVYSVNLATDTDQMPDFNHSTGDEDDTNENYLLFSIETVYMLLPLSY